MTTPSDGAPSPSQAPAVRGEQPRAVRSDESPTIASATPGTRGPRPMAERCDHCGAPVEGNQRYCVQCGAHQRRADDPTARWFAAARRAKAAPALAAGGGAGVAGRRTVPVGVAAVLVALLPLSAGIGVVVGRGSDDSGEQVVAALEALGAGGVAAAGANGTAGDAADTAGASDPTADAAADEEPSAKQDGVEVGEEQAPILATGPTGSARQLTGTKPTKKDVAQSKQAIKQIQSKKGEAYVEQQKDLPDTIVVP